MNEQMNWQLYSEPSVVGLVPQFAGPLVLSLWMDPEPSATTSHTSRGCCSYCGPWLKGVYLWRLTLVACMLPENRVYMYLVCHNICIWLLVRLRAHRVGGSVFINRMNEWSKHGLIFHTEQESYLLRSLDLCLRPASLAGERYSPHLTSQPFPRSQSPPSLLSFQYLLCCSDTDNGFTGKMVYFSIHFQTTGSLRE